MSRKDTPSRDASDEEKADLGRRIDAKLEERKAASQPARPKGWAQGMRYGADFLAGVGVGVVGGLALDRFTPTAPWGLIGGVMLGFLVGTYNVVRAATELNKPDGQSD